MEQQTLCWTCSALRAKDAPVPVPCRRGAGRSSSSTAAGGCGGRMTAARGGAPRTPARSGRAAPVHQGRRGACAAAPPRSARAASSVPGVGAPKPAIFRGGQRLRRWKVPACRCRGGDENPKPRGRPRGAQAVVLVAHVCELLVAGDRHGHVLERLVGEAVPGRTHLRAAGHLRQPPGQLAEGRVARHGEDARLAAGVPDRAVGAAGQEATAVAAQKLHARAVAAAGDSAGRFCRRRHERRGRNRERRIKAWSSRVRRGFEDRVEGGGAYRVVKRARFWGEKARAK
jgi:hypothetical protein